MKEENRSAGERQGRQPKKKRLTIDSSSSSIKQGLCVKLDESFGLLSVKLALLESVVSTKFGVVLVSLLADSTVELLSDAWDEEFVWSNGGIEVALLGASVL